MTIQSAVLGRFVVIRWASQPTEADIVAFDQAVASARQSLSGPVIHIALISEGIEMPPSSIQRPLIKRALKQRAVSESMHMVLEGRGLFQRIGRKFLRGMAVMFGISNGYIHATAEEALADLKKRGALTTSPDEMLAELRQRGLLPCPRAKTSAVVLAAAACSPKACPRRGGRHALRPDHPA